MSGSETHLMPPRSKKRFNTGGAGHVNKCICSHFWDQSRHVLACVCVPVIEQVIFLHFPWENWQNQVPQTWYPRHRLLHLVCSYDRPTQKAPKAPERPRKPQKLQKAEKCLQKHPNAFKSPCKHPKATQSPQKRANAKWTPKCKHPLFVIFCMKSLCFSWKMHWICYSLLAAVVAFLLIFLLNGARKVNMLTVLAPLRKWARPLFKSTLSRFD